MEVLWPVNAIKYGPLLASFSPWPDNQAYYAYSPEYAHVCMYIHSFQFFMTVFTVLRSGSLSSLTIMSKVSLGLFFITVNIFSAQLWADTCSKCSPIEYEPCTYIK